MGNKRPVSRLQLGFGLVEIMVGLVIGLIAVLVIYQVYTVAEGFKRNTTAAGEAQMNGLFSTFVLGMEAANGGAGMAVSATDLGACADPGNAPYAATDPRHFGQTYRPIPAMIYDGGGDTKPDAFVVNYSIATTLAGVALFNVDAAQGAAYQIQSPGGVAAGDLIVGVADPNAGDNTTDCASTKVASVALAAPEQLWVDFFGSINPVGNATINHGAVTRTGPNAGFTFTGVCGPGEGHDPPIVGSNPPAPSGEPFCPYKSGSTLFNMGPANRAQKILYRLCDGRAGCPQPPVCDQMASNKTSCTLESVALLDADGQPLAAPVGNPLASNVVNLKVEYGIANPADPLGLLNTWVQANVGGGWDPATVLTAPTKQINLIKAIRIGIIVQSEQFDKTLGDYGWTLFDCSAAPCVGRLAGTVSASTAPPGNWRFRKYETVIPLRNEIWNRQS